MNGFHSKRQVPNQNQKYASQLLDFQNELEDLEEITNLINWVDEISVIESMQFVIQKIEKANYDLTQLVYFLFEKFGIDSIKESEINTYKEKIQLWMIIPISLMGPCIPYKDAFNGMKV